MNPIELVEKATVNETVTFPEDFPLKYVKFDVRNYGEEYDEYSWSARKSGDFRHIYAFGNKANTIATFKTLAGAKRNFLKQFSHYFAVTK
jgi:hypothetical protein